jgi:nucleoside-diphosphate-sugar epimerase
VRLIPPAYAKACVRQNKNDLMAISVNRAIDGNQPLSLGHCGPAAMIGPRSTVPITARGHVVPQHQAAHMTATGRTCTHVKTRANRGPSTHDGRDVSRILVTGAAGFIGRALCRELVERGHTVLGRTRGPAKPIAGAELDQIGDIGRQTDWSAHLDRIEIVVHLANRAHRRAEPSAGEDEPEAAAALARASAASGVRRFVYISSIRAMGNATMPGAPFRSTDMPFPRDPYGRGKLAIERALRMEARETGLELVILRPPLVYGPGVGANFRALLRLTAYRLPLPFGGIENRRSLIFLDNLVDLAARACVHPTAADRVLLARDAFDLSTPELIRILAAELGQPARLFSVPRGVHAVLRELPVLGPVISRLTLSLQVDDQETRASLGWRPSIPPEIGLAVTARAFRDGL